MLIIGDMINTTRKSVEKAVKERNGLFIQELAIKQIEAGAQYIDVNSGTFYGEEAESLCWLVATVQSGISVPLCIDSSDPEAVEAALKLHKGSAIVNSITLIERQYERLIPVIRQYECKVVALCMGQLSIPETPEERVKLAQQLVTKLVCDGVALEDIFVDPLIRPVAIGAGNGVIALRTIEGIFKHIKGVSTICGLSNISFGLPHRKILNRTFLMMAMAFGLGAAILNPLDGQLMGYVKAARALLGDDNLCKEYIEASRAGTLDSLMRLGEKSGPK